MGEWLRVNELHSQHLTVWEQERELARKEQALSEAAIIILAQKEVSQTFPAPKDD